MNLREPNFQLDLTPTTEYAIAIQAICDGYNLTQDELARFGYIPPLHNMIAGQDRIKRIKKVPVKTPINAIYAPKTELNKPGSSGITYLDLSCHPTPGGPDPYGFGLYEYEISTERGDKIRFWKGRTFLDEGLFGCHYTVVKKSDLITFYRACLEIDRVVVEVDPPILKRGILEDIWANSIGFLQNASDHREKFKQYNIPVKRAIMLAGRPGCGKTMTCKWLRQSCIEQGLEFRVITMEEYRRAYSHGKVNTLFNLHGYGNRGIIIFDDMDIMFEDRDKGNHHLTDFLTNLDGCDPSEGVVFVFTSNRTEGLDGAFIRPGRIDLIITFDSPNKELRRRFISERFHPHILEQIDVEELLERTEVTPQEGENNYPYTYAELEEVRKLLSLDDINKGRVNLHHTLRLFEKHRQEFNERITHFGFGKRMEEDDDYYGFPDDDDEGIPYPPMAPRPNRGPMPF